ncbi:MAG TPA: hypothetical protein VJB93_02010 [Patescibacteria group bacterium]|nr:hypothetical protein [Patescibacteria group bacterium]
MKHRVPRELKYVRDAQRDSIPVVGDEDPTELDSGTDPDADETVLSEAADAFEKKRFRLETKLVDQFRRAHRKGAQK